MDVGRGGQEGGRPKKRTGTSKYDFFKVKVWLGENMDHYYVLSRFLICRMLTVTKIPYIKAVKIALETKKYLVDNNLQDVRQTELENVLFSIIRAKGFDEQYIDCYRMVTQFYQQRQPLCIIICGTAWTGKSTIAQQLASRINIPNVMPTDVTYELLRAGGDSPLHATPLWCRPGLSDAGLVAEFRREARVVRKGMDGDLIKTLSDGKPIIIEGMHLDPGLYIQDFQRKGIIMLPARPAAAISPAHSARTAAAAAAAGGSPHTPQAAGFRRSMTSAPRRGGTADAAAAIAVQEQNSSGAGGGSSRSDRLSLPGRSWSADPEMLAGPAAAGDAAAVAAGKCKLQASAELECRQSTSSCDTAQQQMQRQQHQQEQELAEHLQQQGQQLQLQERQQEQEQRGQLSEEQQQQDEQQQRQQQQRQQGSGAAQDVAAAAAGEHAPDPGFAGTHSNSMVSIQLQAASQGAAAAAEDAVVAQQEKQQPHPPAHSRPASPSSPPAVMMLDELQVCAATAEAMALLQHRQHYQQQQQQQGLGAPGSPYSSRGSEAGPASGSPALSVEHSTTEVVSRQPSCCSPLLSQEPSAHDIGSGSSGCVGVGGGGSSNSALVLPGSLSPLTGSSAAVQRLSRSNSWQQMQPAEHSQHQQQPQPPQGLAPDIVAQSLLEQQQQQQQVGSHVEQLWGCVNQQQQQVQQGSSGPVCNGAAAAEDRENMPGPNSSSNSPGLDSGAAESAGVAADLLQMLVQQGSQQSGATGSPRLSQQQQHQRYGLPPLPPLPPQQPRSPLAGKLGTDEVQQQTGLSFSSPAAALEADRATAAPAGREADSAATAAAAAASAASEAVVLPSKSTKSEEQQQQQAGDSISKLDNEQVQRPLFVPILVYMDEADHVLMQEEAISHLGMFNCSNSSSTDATEPSPADAQAGAAADGNAVQFDRTAAGSAVAADGSSSSGESGNTAVPVNGGEALRRMRLLQEYLCAYEAQGLPVVKVTYGNFGEALDKLHEYILQCIKCAMTESGQL